MLIRGSLWSKIENIKKNESSYGFKKGSLWSKCFVMLIRDHYGVKLEYHRVVVKKRDHYGVKTTEQKVYYYSFYCLLF